MATGVGCVAWSVMTAYIIFISIILSRGQKEGETVLENLQVLCSDCNLAKGNIE